MFLSKEKKLKEKINKKLKNIPKKDSSLIKKNLEKEDSLDKTIDYKKLAYICKEIARKKKFYLLESLAKEILDEIVKEFKVKKVKILIEIMNL